MAEWKVIYQTSTTTADTTSAEEAISFSPGAVSEWRVISVRVWITTGSTSATTTPQLDLQDSGGEVYATFVGPTLLTMGASDTGKYIMFSVDGPTDTAFILPDSSSWRVRIPEIVVPKDWTIKAKTTGGGTGDSMEAWIMAWQRPTL